MSNTQHAELFVGEAVMTVLKGYRMSENPEVARAAAEREIKLALELKKLRELAREQSELDLRTVHAHAA